MELKLKENIENTSFFNETFTHESLNNGEVEKSLKPYNTDMDADHRLYTGKSMSATVERMISNENLDLRAMLGLGIEEISPESWKQGCIDFMNDNMEVLKEFI